jgi:hypothetical protein
MVYCTKCGVENPDDAVNCTKCGASLNATPFRGYRRYGWEGDIHFGGRGNVWGIVIGLFIIMIGASSLLGVDIWDKIWPAFLMLIGLVIIANSFTRRRR